jgi:putative oxidoreductase
MLSRFIRTNNDPVLTIARLALGIMIFAHGAQKMLGWFGGYGFEGTVGWMTSQLGIPALLATLAIAAEFFGGLGLIAGLGSRLAAFGVAATMLVATLMVHASNGFFMNWFGAQQGEGFEFHLLAIALALVVMIRGAGALSLDGLVAKRLG